MPRNAVRSIRPSAAGKYARSRAGAGNGKLLNLADVTDMTALWEFMQDAVDLGVSVTIGRTRAGNAIAVTNFVDGVQHPWYLNSSADWADMIREFEE